MLRKLYHGSENIIQKPLYGYGKKYNDYGLGFYCTECLDMAKEWGAGLDRDGYANCYELECDDLEILNLNEEQYCILHWLAILLQNREFDIGDNRFAVNKFMDWFVDLDCTSSVDALYEFCKQYPEAAFGEPEDKTFLFFAEDKMNSYLIKIICIKNNQNFYVNAYDKTE